MNTWREIGMHVDQRGAGSTMGRWTSQVWETVAPMDNGRRIVAAEFCYANSAGTQAVFRLTSQDVTPVEAVQFAAGLFDVPRLWADYCGDKAIGVGSYLESAIAMVEGYITSGAPDYTVTPA